MSFHTVTVFTLIFCAVTTWHHIFKAWTKLSVVSLSHFIHIVLLSHQVYELQHVCTKQTALISADKRSFIVFFYDFLSVSSSQQTFLVGICSSSAALLFTLSTKQSFSSFSKLGVHLFPLTSAPLWSFFTSSAAQLCSAVTEKLTSSHSPHRLHLWVKTSKCDWMLLKKSR